MKYYSFVPFEYTEIKARVLNETKPFQIDFDYIESRRSRPVDIYDCIAPSNCKLNVYSKTRGVSGGFMLSAGAYRLLLPYLNACVDWQEMFFDRKSFYYVVVYSFLTQQKNNRGYWDYTEISLQEFHSIRPPDIHCFGINSLVFVTEVFKQCVEENGLTGFSLVQSYDSESESIA